MVVKPPREGSAPRLLLVVCAAVLGSLAAPAASAQNVPLPPPGQAQQALQQAILQNPSLADSLRRRLQATGLSPEQIRARLAAAGYPAGLLDAYLGAAQPGQRLPQPGMQEFTAIQALGLGPLPTALAESIHVDTGLIRMRAESLHAESLAVGNYVFGVDVFRRTQITGAVLRPAIYELKEGEALPDLLRAAGGFRPDAALERVTIHRILPAPERGAGPFPRAVVAVPLRALPPTGDDPVGSPSHTAPGGFSVPSIALANGDSVVVDSIAPLDSSYFVVIAGAVNKPGRFPWRDGMTLRELMLVAGGPKAAAYLNEAEIARMPADRSQGQLAGTVRVPLDSSYLLGRDATGRYIGPPGLPFPGSGAPEVPLQPFDNVLILPQPEFELPRTVDVAGQVRFPGSYTLTTGKERLADVIDRAGGLTSLAYAGGVRFVRVLGNVGRVNVDLARALKDRDSRFNIILQSGDSIRIPEYKPSVQVAGAVNAPGSVLWEQGKDLSYYLNAAGGPSWRADQSKVSVRYANGQVKTRHRTLLSRSDPTPGPGSEVLVPVKDTTSHPQAAAILSSVAQIVAALTTIAVIIVNHP